MSRELSEREGSRIHIPSGSDEDDKATTGISIGIEMNKYKKPRKEEIVTFIDSSGCISEYECMSAVVNSVSSSQELVRGKLE